MVPEGKPPASENLEERYAFSTHDSRRGLCLKAAASGRNAPSGLKLVHHGL